MIQGCLAELRQIRQHRHAGCFDDGCVHFYFSHRFGKNGICAGLGKCASAINNRIEAIDRKCICACHNHKIVIRFGIHSCLDAVDHLFDGDNRLIGSMSAALLRHLIFNMHGSGASSGHVADGFGNIEGTAPTRVDIDE